MELTNRMLIGMNSHTSIPFAVAPEPLRLRRWFALTALISITVISAAAGYLLSALVTERMLRQEGELTREFIQSVMVADSPSIAFFVSGGIGDRGVLADSFDHVARMPDVLRANAYDRDRRLIWSSDKSLMGRRFSENEELERALNGELVIHTDRGDDGDGPMKAEHLNLQQRADLFVEIYVPVRDEPSGKVVGAFELYKNPRPLFAALQALRVAIGGGAALAGLFLFLALFGLVRRADRLIAAQQQRLVESETLGAIGEMSSAVAHGIRNPLASIRSSAELALEADPCTAREAAKDILSESDRLEAWVRDLLAYARPIEDRPTTVKLATVVARVVEEFAREQERRRIDIRVAVAEDLPAVSGDPLLLSQVLQTLLANALEAIGQDGVVELRASFEREDQHVRVEIVDTGVGMSSDQLARIGKPFYTTKARGMGVGLALARRILARCGGELEFESQPGRGTTARLSLPASRRKDRSQ